MSARELTGARTEQVAMPLPGLPQPGARPAAAPGPRGTALPSELFLG